MSKVRVVPTFPAQLVCSSVFFRSFGLCPASHPPLSSSSPGPSEKLGPGLMLHFPCRGAFLWDYHGVGDGLWANEAVSKAASFRSNQTALC